MISNNGKSDGKRASEEMRGQGVVNPDALGEALAHQGMDAEQLPATQEIAAVASALSSTASTPAGTPHAKRSNISTSPMLSEPSESMVVQEQHGIMHAMQAAGNAGEQEAERKAEEMRARMADQESMRSVSHARTRRIFPRPHADHAYAATWHMHILLCNL